MFTISRFCCFLLFFFKQKTAYEMRISDWSSDVCSSDLLAKPVLGVASVLTVRVLAQECSESLAVLVEILGRERRGRAETGAERGRSEERRVGKECVSTCRSRWSPDH